MGGLVTFTTVYITPVDISLSHPPGTIFHGRYPRSWNSVGAKKGRRWKRAFRRRIVLYRHWHPLGWVVEQSSLEYPPVRCGIHRYIGLYRGTTVCIHHYLILIDLYT